MELNLKHLQDIGAFVSVEPAKHEIKWKQLDVEGVSQDYTATAYIRRNSCATFEKDMQAAREGSDRLAAKIASTVCDPSGEPLMTYEQAQQLNEGLTQALIIAIAEVNGGGEKNSQPRTKRGTNSSSASAGPQSQN